jgi:hypothetical protein
MIIKIILSILILLTSIPVGLLLNNYTKDEKYLKKFILIVSIACFILALIFLVLQNYLSFITLLYMGIVSIINYIKK